MHIIDSFSDSKMFPPGKDKSKDMIGIFELCNPHLLSEEMLTEQLTSKFYLYSPGITKAQALELFCLNISPKEQRVHRDNRRGVLMKRLQRSSWKKDLKENPKSGTISNYKLNASTSPMKEQENKRVTSEPGGPEAKRSKITWP